MLVKYRFMKTWKISYTRAMRFLPIVISLISFSNLSFAVTCEEAMQIVRADTTAGNIFFNRWNLPDGTKAEPLMSAMIERIAGELKQPLLIFDTNPGARQWSSYNIIPPDADNIFPGQTYRQLNRVQKDYLFAEFTTKALDRLRNNELPVLIFDHHFNSTILSDASATPLIVDYLFWTDKHLLSSDRNLIRQTISEGTVIRDHSDPDILLATTAARMARFPDQLSLYGGLMKDIALYNDHAYMNPNLSPRGKRRILLGYWVMMGFEKAIADGKMSFERAMTAVDAALERVIFVNRHGRFTSEDGLLEMIVELETFYLKHYLEPVVAAMKLQKAERDLFQAQMKEIYRTPKALARIGETAVVRFPPIPDVPSGLEVMQYLQVNRVAGISDAKYVAVVGRETHADGEYWHVKLRVLDGMSRLDPLIDAIREAGTGGGGRSTAGGLYAPAGRKATTPEDLENDLLWALGFLK